MLKSGILVSIILGIEEPAGKRNRKKNLHLFVYCEFIDDQEEKVYPISHVELLDEDYADPYSIVGSTRQVEYDDHLMYDAIIYHVSSSKEECAKAKMEKNRKQKSDIFSSTSIKQGNISKEKRVSKKDSGEKVTHCKGQSKSTKEAATKRSRSNLPTSPKVVHKEKDNASPLQTEWSDESTPKKRGTKRTTNPLSPISEASSEFEISFYTPSKSDVSTETDDTQSPSPKKKKVARGRESEKLALPVKPTLVFGNKASKAREPKAIAASKDKDDDVSVKPKTC